MFKVFTLLVALAVLQSQPVGAAPVERRVAVTIDDLPGPPRGLVSNDPQTLHKNTAKLLAALRRYQVPAIGFVNEGKLFLPDETSQQAKERVAVLRQWTDQGLELGNHTYSHRSLNTTPLETFQDDVIHGEVVTRQLLAEHHKSLRYFRHPYLQVGLDLEKRRTFESFLRSRGYIIAPVTIDNDDYVYAAVYANALKHRDLRTAKKVGEDYLRYMTTVFEFDEAVSQRLFGREIRQVLLIHASSLNADYFGQLAKILQSRGYRFTTLEDALGDEAYQREDTYVGSNGISWLHHWELTSQRARSPSPDAAAWVMQAYEALGD